MPVNITYAIPNLMLKISRNSKSLQPIKGKHMLEQVDWVDIRNCRATQNKINRKYNFGKITKHKIWDYSFTKQLLLDNALQKLRSDLNSLTSRFEKKKTHLILMYYHRLKGYAGYILFRLGQKHFIFDFEPIMSSNDLA